MKAVNMDFVVSVTFNKRKDCVSLMILIYILYTVVIDL